MKKLALTLAAVLCCAALFTSCQKGNTQQQETDKPDTTPAFVKFTFGWLISQDMLDYTNVVITYNDGTGEKSETISSAEEWIKTLTVALPCTISNARKVTLKDGVESQMTEDKKFEVISGTEVFYKLLNKDGAELKTGGSIGSYAKKTGKANKVAESIKNGTLDFSFSYSFDKNGKLQ